MSRKPSSIWLRTQPVGSPASWSMWRAGAWLPSRQTKGRKAMTQPGGTAESQIKALIEAWADAVRRHDYAGVLARHEPDIVMFDVPPPLQSRGMAEYRSTWDLFF